MDKIYPMNIILEICKLLSEARIMSISMRENTTLPGVRGDENCEMVFKSNAVNVETTHRGLVTICNDMQLMTWTNDDPAHWRTYASSSAKTRD